MSLFGVFARARRKCSRRRRLLYVLLLTRRYRDPLLDLGRINFRMMDEHQFMDMFRFRKQDFFDCVIPQFRLPYFVITPSRIVAPACEALAILLRRLSYPNRLHDLKRDFHRDEASLSEIISTTLDHIHDRFVDLMQYNVRRLHDKTLLSRFSSATYAKTGALDTCFGFLDGTVRPLCRPGKYQRRLYNGHKRTHALKYQSIVAPDGLIIHLGGPFVGRRHDARILRESGMLRTLSHYTTFGDRQYTIYADGAYPLRHFLTVGFKGANVTPQQDAFNKQMNVSRIVVEWAFGMLLQYWAFVDYKKNQKIFLQAVGKFYRVSALLTNVHTCLYGSRIGTYFDLESPSIEEYLHSD